MSGKVKTYNVIDSLTPEVFRESLNDGGFISVVTDSAVTIEICIQEARVPVDSDVVSFDGEVVKINGLPASEKISGKIDLLSGQGSLRVI